MKELAQEALNVQDACNLSGVVHSFSRTITELRALLETDGKLSTHEVNTHPVCVLFADKIASLTGMQYLGDAHDAYRGPEMTFATAYNWAKEITK